MTPDDAPPSVKRVFQPIRIGPIEVANRIVRAAHGTHLGGAGIGEDLIAYHEARARGGCGLTIIEATSVHASSSITLYNIDESATAGLRRLMTAVRPHGMRVFQQLYHGGHHYAARDGGPPWGASAIPSPVTGHIPVAMDKAQIAEIVAAFAAATRRCRNAGLDGVEVHGAHGYLLHQFLSPATNRRDDEYGGALTNRMRLLVEVLRAVREAAGDGMAVGVRLSASEAAGGVREDDLVEVVRAIEAEGLIDYLNASWGDYFAMATMVGPMDRPGGYELPSSTRLTAVSRSPRIVSGRFRTLEEAAQVLREGAADMVSLVRAQIADPDLIAKTRAGRADQVRPCIACNQGCVGGLVRDHRIGCLVNPEAGRERLSAGVPLVPVDVHKRVLVIGAGPAGLEAARSAALLGHRVVLAEAQPGLGGAFAIAARAPHMHIIGDLIDWYEREIYRLGVEVRTGLYMDAEDIARIAPDAVILATGADPRMDGLQHADPACPVSGTHLPGVLSSSELLTRPLSAGGTAVVFDEIGHYEALACAEHLIQQGWSVAFVTGWGSVAPFAQPTMRVEPALERLYRGRFEVLTRHRLEHIAPGICTARPLPGGETRDLAADITVLVGPMTPRRAVYDASLALSGLPSILIGDALAPRDAQFAIADGRRAALALATSSVA